MQPAGSIKEWNEQERPREKLLERGALALTDAELVALLIGSGTRERSAVEVGRDLLQSFGGLRPLAAASVQEMTRVRGIGEAKAITLVAAFELARRKQFDQQRDLELNSPAVVADYVRPRIGDLQHEVFYVLLLNRRHRVLSEKTMFSGGVSASLVDIRMVFREALNHLATALIVCHNHPSGSTSPSPQDVEITRRLEEAGRTLDIPLLDHVIITQDDHFSFADAGMIALPAPRK